MKQEVFVIGEQQHAALGESRASLLKKASFLWQSEAPAPLYTARIRSCGLVSLTLFKRPGNDAGVDAADAHRKLAR